MLHRFLGHQAFFPGKVVSHFPQFIPGIKEVIRRESMSELEQTPPFIGPKAHQYSKNRLQEYQQQRTFSVPNCERIRVTAPMDPMGILECGWIVCWWGRGEERSARRRMWRRLEAGVAL